MKILEIKTDKGTFVADYEGVQHCSNCDLTVHDCDLLDCDEMGCVFKQRPEPSITEKILAVNKATKNSKLHFGEDDQYGN